MFNFVISVKSLCPKQQGILYFFAKGIGMQPKLQEIRSYTDFVSKHRQGPGLARPSPGRAKNEKNTKITILGAGGRPPSPSVGYRQAIASFGPLR